MVRDVSEILKQCGWTDGFRIPVSDEENKKLENAVEDAMKKKAQLLADMEEAAERLATIKKHLISGDKQRKNCQELLHETRKELDAAQHLDKLCRSERDSVQKGTKNVEKELQCLTEICDKLQADICKREAQIGKMRKLMRCDSAELLAWTEKHNKGEDDLQMLQTDINEDAAVFKRVNWITALTGEYGITGVAMGSRSGPVHARTLRQPYLIRHNPIELILLGGSDNDLDIKREKLEMDVEQKRKVADSVTTEVAVLEEVLDRTAQLYRQMHDEKCGLLKQWEASVRALHRKDQDINKTLSEIDTLKGQGRFRMAELIEAKEMLENLQNNNAETEAHIAEMQRLTTALRDQDVKLQKDIDELHSELLSIQRMVIATNKRIDATRAENKRLADEKCQKEERVRSLRDATTELCKRYEEASKGAMSAEQRAAQLDELIKAEQHQSNLFNIDIGRLQGTLYRMQTEFTEIENQNKVDKVGIQALKKNAAFMAHAKANQEETLFKAKEKFYNLEVEEQLLTSRIRSLSGERCESLEQQQMRTKVLQLEDTLKEKKRELNLLTNQTDHLELDGRQISNMITTTNAELSRVQDERTNLQLLVDGGKKALKTARCSLNDAMIDLAVLKVRARQVSNAERQEWGKVISLKKQRIEWETATKERMFELNAERDKQNAKRKVLMDDRSMITSELNNLNSKIKQHDIKYAIVSDSVGKDEFGEFISPTQLKLKVAQERILLVEEGDILDAKINKAEKEIEAMENTLKVVNVSNENYRNRLAIIDPDGPEAEELKKVEQQYLETLFSLKKCREEESRVKNIIRELQYELHRLDKQISDTFKIQQCQANVADDLSHDLQEQDVKLHRAESQLHRIIRELRSRSNSAMFIMEEKDIMIRDLTDQNRSALEQLSVLANRFLDACPIIHQLLEERSLSLPPPKARSQSESSRSSVSSEGSSVCSSVHSSESLCTTGARTLFKPSKMEPYRGTMQTLSQLQFPMKKSVLCCAPHSPISLSSETITIPSVTILPPPGGDTPQGVTEAGSLARIHPKPGGLPGESVTAVVSVASAPHLLSQGARRSDSRSISDTGSHLSRTESQASSIRSNGSTRLTRSKETESLIGTLTVESLPLTGKPQASKPTKKGVKSSRHELKQRTDSSKSGEKIVTSAESTQRESAPDPTESVPAIETDVTAEGASAHVAEGMQTMLEAQSAGATQAPQGDVTGVGASARVEEGVQTTEGIPTTEGELSAEETEMGGQQLTDGEEVSEEAQSVAGRQTTVETEITDEQVEEGAEATDQGNEA